MDNIINIEKEKNKKACKTFIKCIKSIIIGNLNTYRFIKYNLRFLFL